MMRASFDRRLAIGAAVIAISLGGCDQLRDMTGMGPDTNGSATTNAAAPASNLASADGSKPVDAAATANPELAGQIAQAAQAFQARVPMQVDQITTLTGVRSNGTEVIYEMAVSQAISPAQLEQVRTTAQNANQTNLCADPNAGRLIRMGASMTHQYTDTAGARFETRVTGC